MELRHLRYFVVAAEEQNFTRAAARLNLSVPALSRRIRDLEQEIGTQLFERRQQRVYLTEAGSAFLDDTRGILGLLTRATGRALSIAERHATALRVGIHAQCTRHAVIGNAISQYLSSTPSGGKFKLDVLSTTPLMSALNGGDLDAIFIHRIDMGGDIEHLDHFEVACDRYVLLVPVGHALAGKQSIRLRDLADEAFIWPSRNLAPTMHDALSRACQQGGFTPRITQNASSVARIQLTAAGAAITFVLAPLWEPWPDNVVARIVDDLHLSFPLEFVWPGQHEKIELTRFQATVQRNALLRHHTLPR